MKYPVVVTTKQLQAFMEDGLPLLCLVIRNARSEGLRLAAIDFALANGATVEISLAYSPKVKPGEAVLFQKIAGEAHIVRTEPRDETARCKLQRVRERFLPERYGN